MLHRFGERSKNWRLDLVPNCTRSSSRSSNDAFVFHLSWLPIMIQLFRWDLAGEGRRSIESSWPRCWNGSVVRCGALLDENLVRYLRVKPENVQEEYQPILQKLDKFDGIDCIAISDQNPSCRACKGAPIWYCTSFPISRGCMHSAWRRSDVLLETRTPLDSWFACAIITEHNRFPSCLTPPYLRQA